jgi:hypothetical protein
VGELIAMDPRDRGIERLEHREPPRGDPGNHHAAILLVARAAHQASSLQPVEQARDVRVSVDHPRGDLPAGQAPAPGATQDPQHVELREGEVGRA